MAPDRAVRCSATAASEPLIGTASPSASWLALEEPGPWGARAPRDSRLPAALAAALEARAAAAGVKLLLIKAPGGEAPADGRRRCLLARSGPPEERFLETVALERAEDALALDLEALGRGERPGAGPLDVGRHYLTCTNGKRDPCCALHGRPVARALGAALPGRAWQATHLGGHRFAANVLVLPDGLLFGRLDPSTAVQTARRLERGELEVARLRGRSGLSPAAQAAEALLRERLRIAGADDVALVEEDGAGAAVFAAGGRRYAVRVAGRALEPRPASCGSPALETPIAWRLMEVADA